LHPAAAAAAVAAACACCVLFDALLLHAQVLQSAKGDERVKGLLTVLGDRANFGGMAQLQELRNALLDFRVRLPQAVLVELAAVMHWTAAVPLSGLVAPA
jgi:hypothetical protein